VDTPHAHATESEPQSSSIHAPPSIATELLGGHVGEGRVIACWCARVVAQKEFTLTVVETMTPAKAAEQEGVSPYARCELLFSGIADGEDVLPPP
jgi:hypothetical protein